MSDKYIMGVTGKRLLGVAVMLTCMILQAAPAEAGIIVSSTVFEGNTFNLISDSSGNEWLSLLATDGQTYGFVSGRIDNAIGDYRDYRIATLPEVVALFLDYGAVNLDAAATSADFPSATTLQNDFGITGSISVGEPLTFGYTSTILVQGSNSFPDFHKSPFVKVQTSKGEAQFRTGLAVDVVNDTHTQLRGTWLIRDVSAVPEPSSFLLALSGLMGGGCLLWVRKGAERFRSSRRSIATMGGKRRQSGITTIVRQLPVSPADCSPTSPQTRSPAAESVHP